MIRVYGVEQQGIGGFDQGKIKEQKPIGFPGEGSEVQGVGPLFYWAWFHSEEEGLIPLHPHQAFEIVTYLLSGKAEHEDTLGTKSVIEAGGMQVMQTGSGVSHQERFVGPQMEGFQIWFEPHFRDALKREPLYFEYKAENFQSEKTEGVEEKKLIGHKAPIELVAEAQMWDLKLKSDHRYQHELSEGKALAVLAVRGNGLWADAENEHSFKEKEFVVLEASENLQVFELTAHSDLHLILIEVPAKVDYPLYRERIKR